MDRHGPGRSAPTAALAAALLTLALVPAAAGADPRLVVRERAPATTTAEQLVRRLGGHVDRRLPLLGGFSATVPARHLAALRRSPAVRSVTRDAVLRPETLPAGCDPLLPDCYDGLPPDVTWEGAVRLDQVPGRYKGDDIGVALIDTGVTPSPDLGGRLLGRVDLTSEGDGLDRYGHGTHMAGLIAGNGARAFGTYEGAGPEANLVSVKVAGWDGATDVSSVIAALQWTVANRARYGLRVVNLSYGTDGIQPADRDPLDYAVERAWRAGLAVVVSAGNTPGVISKPGDDPFVITVGAADVHGTAARDDDTVAPFSGSADGKPDLLAPGMSLPSIRAPGSTVDALNPAARVGEWYFKGSGTSQAAAVVSGVIARMLEADPALTPDQLKGILVATAAGTPVGGDAGAGLVDAAAAVARATPVRRGPPVEPPRANAGVVRSSGLGSIEASRGTDPVYADLDGDGVADPVQGETDVLGRAWDAGRLRRRPVDAGLVRREPVGIARRGGERERHHAAARHVARPAGGLVGTALGRIRLGFGGARPVRLRRPALGRPALGGDRMAVTANAVSRLPGAGPPDDRGRRRRGQHRGRGRRGVGLPARRARRVRADPARRRRRHQLPVRPHVPARRRVRALLARGGRLGGRDHPRTARRADARRRRRRRSPGSTTGAPSRTRSRSTAARWRSRCSRPSSSTASAARTARPIP